MKRLTMTFPDDTDIDFGALLTIASNCIDFHVETIEEPAAATVKKIRRSPRKGRVVGQTAAGVLLKHYFAGGKFKKSHVEKWLKDEGYNPTTASPALSKLRKEGTVTRLGLEDWQWATAGAVTGGAL